MNSKIIIEIKANRYKKNNYKKKLISLNWDEMRKKDLFIYLFIYLFIR